MKTFPIFFSTLNGSAIRLFSVDESKLGNSQILRVDNMNAFSQIHELIKNYTSSMNEDSFLCIMTKTYQNPNGSDCLCTFNHNEAGSAEICAYSQTGNSRIHALTLDDSISIVSSMEEFIEAFNHIKKGASHE